MLRFRWVSREMSSAAARPVRGCPYGQWLSVLTAAVIVNLPVAPNADAATCRQRNYVDRLSVFCRWHRSRLFDEWQQL